jgi:hypothetical protein
VQTPYLAEVTILSPQFLELEHFVRWAASWIYEHGFVIHYFGFPLRVKKKKPKLLFHSTIDGRRPFF